MTYLNVKGLPVLALLLTLLAGGCRFGGSDNGSDLMQPLPVMEYLIGPSDVLTISILNQDAMERTVTVRPDGMISYPLVNEVLASGLAPEQLEEVLTAELSNYMQLIPGELSVVVDEVHSYTVSVLGEVRNPGRFEFQNSATVLDALAEAGGLTEFASRDEILILRTEPAGIRRIEFDYDEVISDPRNVELAVYPGDTVLVP